MKVTSKETRYSNFNPELVEPIHTPLKDFFKTITQLEIEAKTYFDWSDDRLYQLIIANQEDFKLHFKNQDDFLFKSLLIIGHELIYLDISTLNIDNICFDGTKDGIMTEIFNLSFTIENISNKTKWNNESKDKVTLLDTSEGDSEIEFKFSSILSQKQQILTLAKQIFKQLKDKDNTGKKSVEMASIFINVAEYMSLMNAKNFDFNLEGFTNESINDEKLIKKLQNTALNLNATLEKCPFENVIKNNQKRTMLN